MKIIEGKISKSELGEMAKNIFGNLVKAVVDVEKGIMAVDAELHADLEALLLEQGSKQENLWGINLYPELEGDEFVEFDSMINIRPRQNNRSRGVESSEIQKKIVAVVDKLVIK
ncbi:MAG: DUF5674 family protein [Patescibacteria group bacterium]|nr:DUF5674 family protein [Patescibacteria group bacterium]